MSSSCRSSDNEGSGSRASSPPRLNHSPTTHNREGLPSSSPPSSSTPALQQQPFLQLPPIELAPYRDGAIYESSRLESYPDMPFNSELTDSFPPPSQSSSSTTSTSSASSTTTSSLAPLPSSTISSLDEKILHFTTTLAAAAAASGDGKKEANIDELQRKLHFYQVMLWLKRSYRLGGQTSLTKRCVYQDYSNMCTESGTPCLFSPSVFGKVIKRTFPDLQYRRRRINRRINAHYEGLERVEECFDADGHPRAMPIKQEEELQEAERLRLEFQDKKIGGRQNKQQQQVKRASPGDGNSPQETSAGAAKRRRKSSTATASSSGMLKVKKEKTGSSRRRRTGADDDDYLPEDERRSDSDDASSSGVSGESQHPYDQVAGPQPPIDHFWRDWTFPGDAYGGPGGGDLARHEMMRGHGGGMPGMGGHPPHGGIMHADDYDSMEPSFQFMSYLEAGSSLASYSSSTTSAAWRPPPMPSHSLLQQTQQHYHQQQHQHQGQHHMLPPMPSFPPPPLHSDYQSRQLPWPSSAFGPAGGLSGGSKSSPPPSTSSTPSSSHALMPSFPLPSTAPSNSSSTFPSSFPHGPGMLAASNHQCPCPSCLSGRPQYYPSSYH